MPFVTCPFIRTTLCAPRDSKRGLVMKQADEVSEVLLSEVGVPLEHKTVLHQSLT
jgi:hypothetical protein